MASIQERRDKTGKIIAYSIRVHRGRDAEGKQLKPWTTTFKVSSSWTEASARKKAESFAAVFEKECRDGITTDCRKRFDEYALYVLELKEQRGDKHSSITEYKSMTPRIFAEIGHIKLKELRPDHLNALYTKLAKDGANARTGGRLTNRTIASYHRFISVVLSQAVKEGLIPSNPAARADPPKPEKKEANHLQESDIPKIFEALEDEPLKWKMIVHFLLVSGCRRGELLGLKWSNVDFDNSRVYICNTISYTSDRGIYESTPKTERSKRYITLPAETMQLLKQYRAWQNEERLRLGAYYNYQGFVFTQDNGNPIHPYSFSTWFDRFAKRHDLPRLNPHCFRHSMASMLIYAGVDSVSVSKRLGHSQVSTTMNIYSHVMEEADKRNADVIGGILLKSKAQ